jgi:hypothetical protein
VIHGCEDRYLRLETFLNISNSNLVTKVLDPFQDIKKNWECKSKLGMYY